jgi:hypothetical protein
MDTLRRASQRRGTFANLTDITNLTAVVFLDHPVELSGSTFRVDPNAVTEGQDETSLAPVVYRLPTLAELCSDFGYGELVSANPTTSHFDVISQSRSGSQCQFLFDLLPRNSLFFTGLTYQLSVQHIFVAFNEL